MVDQHIGALQVQSTQRVFGFWEQNRILYDQGTAIERPNVNKELGYDAKQF